MRLHHDFKQLPPRPLEGLARRTPGHQRARGQGSLDRHLSYVGNLNSRGPSFCFGIDHIFSNYYENISDGVNTR